VACVSPGEPVANGKIVHEGCVRRRARLAAIAAVASISLIAGQAGAQRAPLPAVDEVLVCAELPPQGPSCHRFVAVRTAAAAPALWPRPTTLRALDPELAPEMEGLEALVDRDFLELVTQAAGFNRIARTSNERTLERPTRRRELELVELERARLRATALEVEEIRRKTIDPSFLIAGVALLATSIAVDWCLMAPSAERPVQIRPRFYPPGFRVKLVGL
jgi:hypothetical protein